MVPRAALCLGLGAALGCGGGPSDVVLDLPDVAGARTLVVGVPERSGVRVRAWDLEDADSSVLLQLEPRPASDPPLEAAYFERSLRSARLEPGWLEAPAPGQSPVRLFGDEAALGPARRVFRATLDGDDPGWASATGPSARLAEVAVGRPDRRCADLKAAWTSEILPVGLGWTLVLDDGAILLVGVDGEQWVVDLDARRAARLGVQTDYVAAARAGDTVYAVDARGQLWAGPGDRGTVVRDPVALGDPLPRGIRALTASAADDVTALLRTGEVHHFDGAAWTRWGQVDAPGRRLFAVGPGEALVLTEQPRLVYRAKDGAVRAEVVAETGILSAAATPVGVLVGSSDGDIFRHDRGGWARLGDERFGWWTMDMVPFDGGVGFLLASGTVSGYRADVGYCDELYNGGFFSDGRLHAIGDRLVALGDLPDTQQTQVILLEP